MPSTQTKNEEEKTNLYEKCDEVEEENEGNEHLFHCMQQTIVCSENRTALVSTNETHKKKHFFLLFSSDLFERKRENDISNIFHIKIHNEK